MNRLPFILPAIAVAVLAGCATSTESGISAAPAPVVTPPAAAAAPIAPAAAGPAAPTYSVGAAGTTVVVPNASTAAVVAPAMAPLRVGFGRIDSMMVVPNAAAGGTAPNTSRRIAMRMDDGTLQHFDTKAENLKVGDRIEITTNGTMRHPA
jgi:hypothetical protein